MIFNELKRRFADKINCHVDSVNNVATFYLHGIITKKILGYQVYDPKSINKKRNDLGNSRYFTYMPSYKKTGEYAIFGLEYLENRDKLFVTEGIFEACRLISLGFDAIAILSSDVPKGFVSQLLTLNENIIWCGDNDKAGNNSNMKIFKRMCFDKDLDEVDEETLINAIKEFE